MTPEIRGGAKVFLRGCPYGKPGTVLKIERGRAVVYWHDLDFLARHKPASLMVVESGSTREMEAAS